MAVAGRLIKVGPVNAPGYSSIKGDRAPASQKCGSEASASASMAVANANDGLFQFGEFRSCGLEDGKVRVRRLPEIEESLIGVASGIRGA